MPSPLDIESVAGDLEDAGKQIRELSQSGDPNALDNVSELADWIMGRCEDLLGFVDDMRGGTPSSDLTGGML